MELYMPKIRNPLGRFQKNHQPFNKGTKGLIKANKTSFREHYFRNRDKITTSIKKTYRSEILRKKYGLEQRTKLRIK